MMLQLWSWTQLNSCDYTQLQYGPLYNSRHYRSPIYLPQQIISILSHDISRMSYPIGSTHQDLIKIFKYPLNSVMWCGVQHMIFCCTHIYPVLSLLHGRIIPFTAFAVPWLHLILSFCGHNVEFPLFKVIYS